MKIEFSVSCLGYSVGGYYATFEMEIEELEIENMNEKEKEEYIEKCIFDYILEDIDYSYNIKED